MTNKLRKEVVKIDIEGPVEIVEIVETVGTVGTVEVIGVIQIQVQKMIRYRSRSRDESRSRSRSRGRSGKPCTYCHKPNHDSSHCYKLARELRKLCTGEKRNKGDKEEEARLNMLSCVKNYIESEKDSTN